MVWLALWCGSGAIGGWAVGRFTGRPGVGAVLGTFCGAFGWLMLLGADPRARAVHELVDASAGDDAEVELPAVVAPAPISWVAQTA